jgi:hypothetical protein
LAYQYLPHDAKAEVLDLAHWLSETHPDLKATKKAFLESAAAFAGVHWSPPEGIDWGGPEQAKKRKQALDQARANADQDFHQRLVSDILKAAVRHRLRRFDQEPTGSGADCQAERSLSVEIRHVLDSTWSQDTTAHTWHQAVRTIRAHPEFHETAMATAIAAIQQTADPKLRTPEGERALVGRMERHMDAALRWHAEHDQVVATVLASTKLKRLIQRDSPQALEALKTAHPDLSAKQLAQHATILADQLRQRMARHRTQTTRTLLQSLIRGLGIYAHEAQYAAYLSAKDRYAHEKAEWELATAQGLSIAR